MSIKAAEPLIDPGADGADNPLAVADPFATAERSSWLPWIELAAVVAIAFWGTRLYRAGRLKSTLLSALRWLAWLLASLLQWILHRVCKTRGFSAASPRPEALSGTSVKRRASEAESGPLTPERRAGSAPAVGDGVSGAAGIGGSGIELSDLRPAEPVLVGLGAGETALLSSADVRELMRHLPSRCHGKALKLLFSTSQNGYSLATLLNRCRGHGPTLLVVMDEASQVFGGFASRDWSGNDLASSTVQFSLGRGSSSTSVGAGSGSASLFTRTSSYFGSGEAFLFRCKPTLAVYRWTRRNSDFQLARRDLLALGGGGGKFGLCLDAGLERGWTGRCDTFDNPPLASEEAFRVVRVEAWGFVLPHKAAASDSAPSSAAGTPAGKPSISSLSAGLMGRGSDLANGPLRWIQLR